jgi:hypothetical protein
LEGIVTQPYVSQPDLLVLHAVRLRGFVEPSGIADMTGLAEGDIADHLAKAAAADLVVHREGRLSGWSLTPAGKATHAERLAEEKDQAACADMLNATYEGFLVINEAVKTLCTDWQMRTAPDGSMVPNDHTDAAYDGAIRQRLQAVHGEVTPALAPAAARLQRFGRYQPRLAAAQQRFSAGDASALARPLSGSYHDVWMELHEDLLLTLGRSRSAADGH